jgi:hypothetical protein
MEESGSAQAQAGGGGGGGSGPSRQGKRAAGGGAGDGQMGKQRKGMGLAGGSRREEKSDGDVGGDARELPGACVRLSHESKGCDRLAIASTECEGSCLACVVIAGPKLGNGPRWNLQGAVQGKESEVKCREVMRKGCSEEIVLMEETSKVLKYAKKVLKKVLRHMGPEELMEFGLDNDVGPEDLDSIIETETVDSADATRAYIKQLEAENRALKEGSDTRCTKMLQQALSGSDDADVDFLIGGGSQGVGLRGHQGMLCAGSKEYAGLFRSGMVEAQEGKIGVPPCVGAESFRGFLEWLYLGELRIVTF